MGEITKELLNNMALLVKKQIPQEYPIMPYGQISEDTFSIMQCRDSIVELQGYALVAKNWIDLLVSYIKEDCSSVIELMAGQGVITHELVKRGIRCLATDSGEHTAFAMTRWVGIEDMDAVDAVMEYPADYYIVSWPPHASSICYDVLMAMREHRPESKMIFIGELGGCCATDEFAEAANIIWDDHEFNEISMAYRSWGFIRDEIHLIV